MPPCLLHPHAPRRCTAMLSVAMLLLGCEAGQPPSDAASAPAAPEAVERGRHLLATYQCGSCHTIPGVEDARGTAAGTLAGFGRRVYIAGRLANEDAQLAAWIVDPRSHVPGTRMPAMGVPAADARDMAAYLRQLE